MNVAVIGGGFYGVMAALKAAEQSAVSAVTIYEQADSILSGAGKYNQARLHLGCHYPRSRETIKQSKLGFQKYLDEFPDVCGIIDNNIYIVRSDGEVSIDDYFSVIDEQGLKYDSAKLNDIDFHYKDGGVAHRAIAVEERYIDIGLLKRSLMELLSTAPIIVKTNTKVSDLDPNQGSLKLETGKLRQHDIIVNCSYTQPFMGFPEPRLKLKYEYCVLALISAPSIENTAVTIMDGPFVSVYPWLSGLHSVSSVTKTPMLVDDDFHNLQKRVDDLSVKQMNQAAKDVLNEMDRFLDLEYAHVAPFASYKMKVSDDYDDRRLVQTFSNHKLFTVLPGKLDAVNIFTTELVDFIGGFS